MVRKRIASFAVSVALALAGGFAPAALAQGVQPRFDLNDPQRGPFPTDQFTVPDASQLTGLRVNLPKPDCSVGESDCDDIDVLNQLDGFNLQPRLSIPFTGAIDPKTVSSHTVFLVKLACLVARCPGAVRVGINQVVWDPDGNTLYAESDESLDQDARYLLVITDGVRDAAGNPIEAAPFRRLLNFGQTKDSAAKAYRADLLEGLNELQAAGVPTEQVSAASVFTTQSATAVMEKIRDQVQAAATPDPPDFTLGSNGERTVFPLADVRSVVFNRQITTTPMFTTTPVPISVLKAAGGAVGTIAYGEYLSPNYETPQRVIPAIGTRTGTPRVYGTSEVYFNLVLPAGTPPPAGWPVAIVGHGGGGGNKNGIDPIQIAAALAQRGIAAITFGAFGHGGGPLGTLVVSKSDGSTVTLPAGGRGVDDNGDGIIGPDEGMNTLATGPLALVTQRDGYNQAVIDAMQLVRVIQRGIDVNDDSIPDLDPSRIYFWGASLSGIWGTEFVALEPAVRAAVIGPAGGPIVDAARLGINRPSVGQLLALRSPSLLNDGPVDPFTNTIFPFDENLPLRNQPPVINDVPGAIAIQQVLDRLRWAMQSSNPVAYAPHLRLAPLAGVRPGPVLFMFAKGDKTVPNPTTSALLRAGHLRHRTLYYRYDLEPRDANGHPIDANGHQLFPNDDPHTFAGKNAAVTATFLASDGTQISDPDGPGPLWETPIVGPLPDDRYFIGPTTFANPRPA